MNWKTRDLPFVVKDYGAGQIICNCYPYVLIFKTLFSFKRFNFLRRYKEQQSHLYFQFVAFFISWQIGLFLPYTLDFMTP